MPCAWPAPLRVAPKIAKFEGAYHGIDDPALISYVPPVTPALGPEDAPNAVLSCAGLAPATAENVLVLPFNNARACERLIRHNAEELACGHYRPALYGGWHGTARSPNFSPPCALSRGNSIFSSSSTKSSVFAWPLAAHKPRTISPQTSPVWAKSLPAAPRQARLAVAKTRWLCTIPQTGRPRFHNLARTTATRSRLSRVSPPSKR